VTGADGLVNSILLFIAQYAYRSFLMINPCRLLKILADYCAVRIQHESYRYSVLKLLADQCAVFYMRAGGFLLGHSGPIKHISD